MPNVGREKPRPAQQVAIADGIDQNRRVIAGRGLENDLPALNQIKTVSRFALSKKNLIALEMDAHRAIGEQSDVMLVQPDQKRVRRDIRL